MSCQVMFQGHQHHHAVAQGQQQQEQQQQQQSDHLSEPGSDPHHQSRAYLEASVSSPPVSTSEELDSSSGSKGGGGAEEDPAADAAALAQTELYYRHFYQAYGGGGGGYDPRYQQPPTAHQQQQQQQQTLSPLTDPNSAAAVATKNLERQVRHYQTFIASISFFNHPFIRMCAVPCTHGVNLRTVWTLTLSLPVNGIPGKNYTFFATAVPFCKRGNESGEHDSPSTTGGGGEEDLIGGEEGVETKRRRGEGEEEGIKGLPSLVPDLPFILVYTPFGRLNGASGGAFFYFFVFCLCRYVCVAGPLAARKRQKERAGDREGRRRRRSRGMHFYEKGGCRI